MTLTRKLSFQGELQKRNNMIQVPKIIRWQFKLEPTQVLRIGVSPLNMGMGWQFFYSKMRNDGRLIIPKLTMGIFQVNQKSLAGYVLEVTLEPVASGEQ
jgi:hypothetical protein